MRSLWVQQTPEAGVRRVSAGSALADALNDTLGLELADFKEARAFLKCPEGSEMLDAWLASQPDNDEPNA